MQRLKFQSNSLLREYLYHRQLRFQFYFLKEFQSNSLLREYLYWSGLWGLKSAKPFQSNSLLREYLYSVAYSTCDTVVMFQSNSLLREYLYIVSPPAELEIPHNVSIQLPIKGVFIPLKFSGNLPHGVFQSNSLLREYLYWFFEVCQYRAPPVSIQLPIKGVFIRTQKSL